MSQSVGIYSVYEHIRADNMKPFYVGKGTKYRPNNFGASRRSKQWKEVEIASGGVLVRILFSTDDEDLAFLGEMERIDQLKRVGVALCNRTDGGPGAKGLSKSPELRKRMGDIHRGKVLSEEVRKKISDSVKASGYRPSEEAIKKRSEYMKGRKIALGHRHTEEWKKAASIARIGNKSKTGQKLSDETKKKMSAAKVGRTQAKKTCPNCGKIGGNSMLRFHFDNCKSLKVP